MCNGCLFDGVESLPSHDGRLAGMAIQYANLGAVYEQRGDLFAAREHGLKARDLFTRAQMPHMAEKAQRWLDGLP